MQSINCKINQLFFIACFGFMFLQPQSAFAKERYFRHFKGGTYKYIHSAFDSETQERMVVYQALYGEKSYWVRPEKMFFETIERDGRRFSRFTEIDI